VEKTYIAMEEGCHKNYSANKRNSDGGTSQPLNLHCNGRELPQELFRKQAK
jgi:hypothetical protein